MPTNNNAAGSRIDLTTSMSIGMLYRFENNGSDSSGRSNTLTRVGTAGYTGPPAYGVYSAAITRQPSYFLRSTTLYIDFPYCTIFGIWIKLLSSVPDGAAWAIMGYNEAGSNTHGSLWLSRDDGAGTYSFYLKLGPYAGALTTVSFVSNSEIIGTDRFYLVGYEVNAEDSIVKLYVDGVKVAEGTHTFSSGGTAPSERFSIGCSPFSNSATYETGSCMEAIVDEAIAIELDPFVEGPQEAWQYMYAQQYQNIPSFGSPH
jgi:hypothetical protein